MEAKPKRRWSPEAKAYQARLNELRADLSLESRIAVGRFIDRVNTRTEQACAHILHSAGADEDIYRVRLFGDDRIRAMKHSLYEKHRFAEWHANGS